MSRTVGGRPNTNLRKKNVGVLLEHDLRDTRTLEGKSSEPDTGLKTAQIPTDL